MKFSVQSGELTQQTSGCFIIGFYEDGSLTQSGKTIDKLSGGYITRLLKQGDFKGKIDQSHLLYQIPHVKAERVILTGCGKPTTLSERNFRKIIASSIRVLNSAQAGNAILFLTELEVENRDIFWKIEQIIRIFSETTYLFEEFKSEKMPVSKFKGLVIYLPDRKQLKTADNIVQQAAVITEAINYTKNLENLPSNICTPSFLAEQAMKLSELKIKVTVLGEKQIKKIGMNALLAVGKGSAEPPKLIILEYHGTEKNKPPIALVGKGITFDTGGISLKPAENMIGMKYDMCGAACVMGTLKAAAELQLPINLVGLLATAENMPGGAAVKPEDIVTTLSGQTVEILNTDAEGRLVLSDAITYSQRYKPNAIIDIATLTGAVVIALGHHASGLLSNNQELAQELLTAGNESFDRAWQMPLWEEYQDQIKSNFADMANTGGRTAGAITAACFLSRFAKKTPWAHLDVAGTAAMMYGTERFATGRPIPLLMQFLLNRCKKKNA